MLGKIEGRMSAGSKGGILHSQPKGSNRQQGICGAAGRGSNTYSLKAWLQGSKGLGVTFQVPLCALVADLWPDRGAGTLIPSAQRLVWAAKHALGTTRISGSLSCGAREVRSPCAWRGGARPGSRVTGGVPGESQGRGSLVGCRLWGRTESDTTEVT